MKVIFEKCSNGDLLVYIHCTTAVEQVNLDKKIFTHSEYTTKWDSMLQEWSKKDYYKYFIPEGLIGSNTVITTLTFVNGRNDNFIKELSAYFEDTFIPSGHLIITYQQFESN